MLIRSTVHGAGSRQRRGVVLLAVLVVVTLLTLAAYQYGSMMMSEYKAADASRRTAMARAAARSGIDYAAAAMSSSDYVQNTLSGNPWDNSSAFQGVVVGDSEQPRFKTMFSLVAPLDADAIAGLVSASGNFRYGVVDEGSKLNIQALMTLDSSGQTAKTALMKLPGMTDDASDSILDWIDSRTTMPRANGAKDTYYTTLNPPYHCKNGPLDSLEELLLVKGITPQLLFGNDRNRNGIYDPEEADGSGIVDRGWSQYITIYSRELNVDSSGNPRLYLNDSDLQTLYTNLQTAVGDDLAAYIIAYRQYGTGTGTTLTITADGSTATTITGQAARAVGAAGGGGATLTGMSQTPSGQVGGAANAGANTGAGAQSRGGAPAGGGGATPRLSRSTLNLTGNGPQANSISSLYSLINSSVSIPATDSNGNQIQGAQPTVYQSPMSDPASIRQLFPSLYDKTTTQTNGEFPGRVNVTTATQAVLTALPGFSDSDVQAIIAHRPDPTSTTAPDPIFQTPAWLLTEANISANTLQTVDRYITARPQVYRVQSVGYFEGGGPTARIEAIIDTNGGRPRIIYWRDLTEMGKGYDLGQ
jgi:type II secretory pathway component PulK